MIKRREVGPRHIFIPDTQIRPDVPIDHLAWLGRYVAEKRPSVLVIAGDWYDMKSLSSYDDGKLSSHGQSYAADIEAGDAGLRLFENELKKHAPRGYKPRKVVTLGNHENRIARTVEANPKLEGKLSMHDLSFAEHGWTVYPFLKPVEIDRVTYMHYCPLNAQGRVSASQYGAPSALAQARRMMRSTVCGHKQGLDTATIHTPGRTVRSVIAGSFYQHQEAYLTPCGETYWRGILVFNDVRPDTGEFDICEVSMDYLERRYG